MVHDWGYILIEFSPHVTGIDSLLTKSVCFFVSCNSATDETLKRGFQWYFNLFTDVVNYRYIDV